MGRKGGLCCQTGRPGAECDDINAVSDGLLGNFIRFWFVISPIPGSLFGWLIVCDVMACVMGDWATDGWTVPMPGSNCCVGWVKSVGVDMRRVLRKWLEDAVHVMISPK